LRLALRLQQLDGDVVEYDAGIGAGDVREAAARVADLSIGQDYVDFGPAGDGIDEVSGAERDGDVGQVMLMEQRCAMRGNAYAINADVRIFKYELMMRFR
jgi:hypothetical protein